MIDIASLTFGYGRKALFDCLSLHLEGGRTYGLLGLNGAGKTSLLKLMAGALSPLSGDIEVLGRVPARREATALADTAFVPEDPALPAMKASAYLSRYAVFRPAFDRPRFDELRRDFALEEDKSLAKLSYGQRKKFALAAALASGARVALSLGLGNFGERRVDASFTFGNGFYRASGMGLSPRADRVIKILFDAWIYAILPAFALLFGAAKVAEKEGRDEVQ